MLRILLIITLLIFTFKDRISNYTNYVNYQQKFEEMNVNCPSQYNRNFHKLSQYSKTLQPFGYTPNEYLDKTRFLITDQPLPTNPDFFI